MVKISNLSLRLLLLSILLATLPACNEDFIDDSSVKEQRNECILILKVIDQSRSQESSFFREGDKLYLYFEGGANFTGTAIYIADNKWKLSYDEEPSNNCKGSCKLAFPYGNDFTIPYEGLKNIYGLDSSTKLYLSQDGKWDYSDGVMTIFASFKPAVTTLKFVSEKPIEIMIKGLCPLRFFDAEKFILRASSASWHPCYPQTIKINNLLEDGKYYSDEYYCLGIGPNHYVGYFSSEQGARHTSDKADSPYYTDCTVGDYIYVYDKSDINYCYRRHHSYQFSTGDMLIINIPSRESFQGWERIENKIKDIASSISLAGDTRSYRTDIYGSCGFSVNFGVKKTCSSTLALYIEDGSLGSCFYMTTPNKQWENYSCITHNWNYIDCNLYFWYYGGVASGMEFKDVSYSHFPYYDQYKESN